MPSDAEFVPGGVCLERLKPLCANPAWLCPSQGLQGKWQGEELPDLLGGSREQLPRQRAGERRVMPEGGSVAVAAPGRTCDYTFLILTTGWIQQLCLAESLPPLQPALARAECCN